MYSPARMQPLPKMHCYNGRRGLPPVTAASTYVTSPTRGATVSHSTPYCTAIDQTSLTGTRFGATVDTPCEHFVLFRLATAAYQLASDWRTPSRRPNANSASPDYSIQKMSTWTTRTRNRLLLTCRRCTTPCLICPTTKR